MITDIVCVDPSMNPFSLESNYDSYLAEILTKISKASSISFTDALNDLLKYLPSSNYHSDYKIILKTLQPHFSSNGKLTINKIVYFLAKKIGVDVIQSIQIQWLYENIESDDPYAKKIIDDYLDISKIACEFERFLKWEDPLKDLMCFKFLIERSKQEHTFDVSKLSLQTYLEFDLLFDILQIIKSRNPIQMMSVRSLGDTGSTVVKSIFDRILSVSSSLFVNKKYKILFEIFGYYDDSIYSDVSYFNSESLNSLIKLDSTTRKIDYDRLKLKTIDQLCVILPYVSHQEDFIMSNIDESMCLFELIDKFDIISDMLVKSPHIFSNIVKNSIMKHFKSKSCLIHAQRQNKLSDAHKKVLEGVYDTLENQTQIIVASLLDKKLSDSRFALEDIEDVMEYSVRVFPVDFFLKERFSSTGLYFIKNHCDVVCNLIKKGNIDKFLGCFRGTKPEHITRYIDEIGVLKIYLGTLPKDEIKKLYFLNTNEEFKIVYLFYLRDEIEPFSLDYSLVFEHFFQIDFLKYLINRNINVNGFIECSVDYITAMEFKNSILYNEFNFDTDSTFYYNLGLPVKDKALKAIFIVLSNCKVDWKLEFLMHITEILLFLPVRLSEKLKKMMRNPEEQVKIRETFDLKDKSFVVDRLFNEFSEKGFNTKVKQDTLVINSKKAVDVILRSLELNRKYLYDLNSSYLSHKSLRNVIKSICTSGPSNFTLISSSVIDMTPESSANFPGKMNQPTDDQSIEARIELINLSSSKPIDNNHNDNDNTSETISVEQRIVDKFFTQNEVKSILDFTYLIENDEILQLADFRSERLQIYEPYIELISGIFSEMVINMYSIAKLETANDDDVFDLVMDPLKSLKRSFWLVLSRILHKISNIYVSFFIEKILMRYLDSVDNSFIAKYNIISIREYLKMCCSEEFDLFAFVFPNLFSRLNVKKTLDLGRFIKPLENTTIDGGRITYSTAGSSHKLRFVYRADSLIHQANITIPSEYPLKKPRIEFDGSMKNLKFYHKLNEMLSRTSKFVEIFLLWKVDIDNHLMGYSECLICYFIMEPKYRTLPEFKCSVCKNAFHDKCIYKWASESKKGTCPFCRSELPLWEKQ